MGVRPGAPPCAEQRCSPDPEEWHGPGTGTGTGEPRPSVRPVITTELFSDDAPPLPTAG